MIDLADGPEISREEELIKEERKTLCWYDWDG